MKFISGRSDSISARAFARIKWLLSAISVAMTSGFVMLLHAHA